MKTLANPARTRIRAKDFPAATVAAPAATTPRLWEWPHLLSLDAPLVALGWQLWWARWTGVSLGWAHHAVLGLSVWLIYLADRLADSLVLFRGNREAAHVSSRHHFSRRHRWALGALVVTVVATLVVLAPLGLPVRDFRAGLGLLALQAGYFFAIHFRGHRRILERMPWLKEAWVGASFALGTAWFPGCALTQVPTFALGAVLTGFGLVCFLNCALISDWENPIRARGGNPRGAFGWACAGLAALGVMASPFLGAIVWPLVMGAAGLWWLDQQRATLPREALRVLADVVLMAPWVFLFLG